MNKKISVGLAITIAIIAMTVTFSITMILAMQLYDRTVTAVQEKATMYDKLSEIDKYVRANAFYDINTETLSDTIASGYMLGIGDRYATYYTVKAYTDLLDVQNGAVIGIGVELVKDNSGYAKIIKVYDGSPAAEMGMVRGGYITAVDGVDVRTLSTRDAVIARLRGQEGTSLVIGYLSPLSEASELTITRTPYETPTVEYQLIGNSCGYLKIRNFSANTPSELDYAVRQAQNAGATSLIFDLRDNAGGLLDSAITCIDLLAPAGPVAFAEARDGSRTELGVSNVSEVDLPMVCIVNGSTASSAELFALSLREFGKAQLIGTRTYGKGTIQAAPYKLSDGSAVVLTVARLLTGHLTSFDGTGIEPDVEVALTADEEQAYYDLTIETDSQIQRAVELASSITFAQANGLDPNSPASSSASGAPEDGGEETGGEGEAGEGENGEGENGEGENGEDDAGNGGE